jgi:hypothetical protein
LVSIIYSRSRFFCYECKTQDTVETVISTATVAANKATVAANKILGVGVVDYCTDTRASLFIFPLSHSAHKEKKRQ